MSLQPGDQLGRFRVDSAIGSGGMGTVYRAYDERLQRDVAIKVLNADALSDQTTIARFKREAKAVAGLSHNNIVALHDFEESGGVAYAVMELLHGETLDARLEHGPLDHEQVIGVSQAVVSGLAAAHRSGVIHRDIKPSNIFLTTESQVKLLDFGLATARGPAWDGNEGETVSSEDLRTSAGTIMGTVGYMSPEQVRGTPTDQTTDIFSFGAVLFEMVTGTRAFKCDTSVETMTAILNDAVPEVTQSALPTTHPLYPIIERCLAKDPAARFTDSNQLLAELQQANTTSQSVQSQPAAGVSRAVLAGTAALVIAVCVATALIWFGSAEQQAPTGPNTQTDSAAASTPSASGRDREPPPPNEIEKSREEILPQLLELVRQGREAEAFALAETVQEQLADDPVFQSMWEQITFPLSITSEPEGASVSVRDYLAPVNDVRDLGATPIEGVRVSRTAKVLRVSKTGFRERVIAGDSGLIGRFIQRPITLEPENAFPPEMVRIPAGNGFPLTGMRFGIKRQPDQTPPSRVMSFLMDRYEVSNREFAEFVKAGGYTNPDYWTDPITIDGRPLEVPEISKRFVDATGRPGPATWEVGTFPEGTDNEPVRGVSWYEARAYARFVGKDLPTVYHWSRATPTLFTGPWLGNLTSRSNIDSGRFAPVGSYHGLSVDGVFDLAGNVSEWVFNGVDQQRLSLGGSALEKAYFFNYANAVDPLDRAPQRGFRCVQYLPDAAPTEIQLEDVQLEIRDYKTIPEISDEVFAAYRNQFRYDATPLNAEIIYRKTEEYPDFIKERIEIDAAYDGERIILYLYLPKTAKPPYQTLVYFRNATSIRPASSEKFAHAPHSFIMKSGRALVHPVVKGTFERWDGLESWTSKPTQKYAEFLKKWVKDYLRTMDYVETRAELDASKIGYIGDSWGGFNGLIIPAVEPRLKLSVCYVGGLSMQRAPPEVDQISYIARVTLPVLWLSGRFDPIFPLHDSAEPAFRHLGTAAENKRHVIYNTGHSLPRQEQIRETLDWLDQHFGTAN